MRAVRPESGVGLVPYGRDVLVTLPAGAVGRFGGEDATGWGRFSKTKLGPLVRAGDGAFGESRVMAAAAVRDDLVVYVRADGEQDAGVYVYRTRRDELVRAADAAEISSQLAAGAALDLAEPSFVVAGDVVWLVLRIADETSLLRLDARQVANGTPRLSRPFETLTEIAEATEDAWRGRSFRVERDDVWFTDTDTALALLRPTTGECWRVGVSGRLAQQPRRSPRPAPAAPPLVLLSARPGDGPRELEFFTGISAGEVDPATPAPEAAQYPLLVLRGPDGKATTLDRDAITMRLGFPKRGLRLTAWCVDGDSVIAYDAMSGEVFRMVFSNTAKPD